MPFTILIYYLSNYIVRERSPEFSVSKPAGEEHEHEMGI